MDNISVDMKLLENKILDLRNISSNIGEMGDSLTTIRYDLDSDLRYRENINGSLSSLCRELNDLEQDVYNSADVIDQAIMAYGEAEKQLLKSIGVLNEDKGKPSSSYQVTEIESESDCIDYLKDFLSNIPDRMQEGIEQLENLFEDIGKHIASSIKHLLHILSEYKVTTNVHVTEPVIGSVKDVDADGSDATIPVLSSVLEPNSIHSEDVKVMQRRLNELGYRDSQGNKLAEDGYFGDKTLALVNQFKEERQLWNHDQYAGKVGDTTWVHLFGKNNQTIPVDEPIVDPIIDILDSEIVDKLTDSQRIIGEMPPEYAIHIQKLMEEHPNWRFEFYDAGLTLDDIVNKQYNMDWPTPKIDIDKFKEANQVTIQARITNFREKYPNTKVKVNGVWTKIKDMTDSQIDKYLLTDGGFYLSSKDCVEHYTNPVNFLDEKNIYQFLEQGFNAKSQNLATVKKMLQNTYFEKDLDHYADVFYNCAKEQGVNPYVLVSKAIIEGGAGNVHSKNSLLVGYNTGGKTVYNFFGIGAYDGNATANGGAYALDKGWTTPEMAIEGGAKFIGSSYIKAGQDTYYTMRYNLTGEKGYINSNQFTHQYASNVGDASAKGRTLAGKLKDYNEGEFTFKIPVFR